MKKTLGIISLLFAVILFALSCNQNKETGNKNEEGPISQDSLVKRGDYLVTILDCDICHSPKKMGPRGPELDPALRLSGHPAKMPLETIDTSILHGWLRIDPSFTTFVGPWGVSFSANLTSDETGLGNWSEEQFFTAIKKGKFKGLEGGRSLLPPMPWESFSHMTDEDLRSIFTYLKSTKPVDNVVPPPIPPNEINKR